MYLRGFVGVDFSDFFLRFFLGSLEFLGIIRIYRGRFDLMVGRDWDKSSNKGLVW